MISKIIKPIQSISSFIDEMMHLSISQWDVEQTTKCKTTRQQR